jgi:hypothetical protein
LGFAVPDVFKPVVKFLSSLNNVHNEIVLYRRHKVKRYVKNKPGLGDRAVADESTKPPYQAAIPYGMFITYTELPKKSSGRSFFPEPRQIVINRILKSLFDFLNRGPLKGDNIPGVYHISMTGPQSALYPITEP